MSPDFVLELCKVAFENYCGHLVLSNIKKYIGNNDLNTPEISMWGPNTYPQLDKDWKTVARKASICISERISELIDNWDGRNNVIGQIKQQVLDKFKNDIELFEDQIKKIEGTFLGAETKSMVEFHQSMKPRSNVKAMWKADKKQKASGIPSLGLAVGEATSLNVKNAEVKGIFKDYSKSSKVGELMRQATVLFIQDLTPTTIAESLKRYFTRFTKEIDEISRLIPTFLEMDRELIKTLTANVQATQDKLSEFYPEHIIHCSTLRSQLDLFYCWKLMKTDFTFASFKIENNKTEIGEGSFAKVYKARMPNSDVFVALKVCKENLKESTVSDVLMEHQTSRELRHRNIIRYFGSSRIIRNGEFKFVMVLEYCSQTLQQLLESERDKVPSRADTALKMSAAMSNMADLACQICSGLGYLHQKSIVHRDLKTENILVTYDRVIKLSDLGLAKVGMAVTMKVGSPVYMAPEILLESNAPYDIKADIYSLGIMLWELWYGEDVANHIQVRIVGGFDDNVKHGLRPSVTKKHKPPADWANVFTKCWSKEANQRPTCDVLLDFFHCFMKTKN